MQDQTWVINLGLQAETEEEEYWSLGQEAFCSAPGLMPWHE